MSLRPPLRALHIGVRNAIVMTTERIRQGFEKARRTIVGVLDLVLSQRRSSADVVEELPCALHRSLTLTRNYARAAGSRAGGLDR